MPVLARIRERFAKEKPLTGLRMSACLHVTAETANLARALQAGGADLVLIASNPLSTQDDVAASLVQDFGISIFAVRGEDTDTYYKHVVAALEHEPHVTMDDGADLVSAMVFVSLDRLDDVHPQVRGVGAEDVAGRAAARHRPGRRQHGRDDHRRQPPAGDGADGVLKFPVIAVNDAPTKHFFDNRYGTGQSTLDGVIRATNMLIAGRRIVVCRLRLVRQGRGPAGARPRRQRDRDRSRPDPRPRGGDGRLSVMPMAEAAPVGDVFITVTGNAGIVRGEHFAAMKDGAVVCNSGHFDVELDLPALPRLASKVVSDVRPHVDEYQLQGRPTHLCARPGPAGEPGGGGRPPAERHGHELRHAGAGDGVLLASRRAS